jgi:hypothetical protein
MWPFTILTVSAPSALCYLLLLSLSPSMGRADVAEDYFVHFLPGAPEDSQLKMHAGLVFFDVRLSLLH